MSHRRQIQLVKPPQARTNHSSGALRCLMARPKFREGFMARGGGNFRRVWRPCNRADGLRLANLAQLENSGVRAVADMPIHYKDLRGAAPMRILLVEGKRTPGAIVAVLGARLVMGRHG